MNTYLITYRFAGTHRGYQRWIDAVSQDQALQQFLNGRFGNQPRSAITIERVDLS